MYYFCSYNSLVYNREYTLHNNTGSIPAIYAFLFIFPSGQENVAKAIESLLQQNRKQIILTKISKENGGCLTLYPTYIQDVVQSDTIQFCPWVQPFKLFNLKVNTLFGCCCNESQLICTVEKRCVVVKNNNMDFLFNSVIDIKKKKHKREKNCKYLDFVC